MREDLNKDELSWERREERGENLPAVQCRSVRSGSVECPGNVNESWGHQADVYLCCPGGVLLTVGWLRAGDLVWLVSSGRSESLCPVLASGHYQLMFSIRLGWSQTTSSYQWSSTDRDDSKVSRHLLQTWLELSFNCFNCDLNYY